MAGDVRLNGLRGGPLVGLADNRPETLRDPRFAATGIKHVRVTVPYDDIALGGRRRAVQDAFFANARQTGVQPLVSFYRSSRGIGILPTEAQFRRHVRLFRARYPWVKYFSTWNEANFRSQPTSRDPARTAAFYRILRDECSGGRCTVVTCDFRPDGTAKSARWLETFKRGIAPGRHIWGLAPYVDVNRRSTALTRDFLRRTSGPVWADEVGALNFFGKGVRPEHQAPGPGHGLPAGRLRPRVTAPPADLRLPLARRGGQHPVRLRPPGRAGPPAAGLPPLRGGHPQARRLNGALRQAACSLTAS